MATFLYRIRATRPEMLVHGLTPREEAAVGAHFEYLVGLEKQGIVQFAGRTQNTDGEVFGIALYTAEGEDAARAIMENDPAVQAGVMEAELFPFAVAIPFAR